MDPNANLDEQLRLAERLAAADISNNDPLIDVVLRDAQRLAELVEALDHWITGGGALPSRWRK